ncbi:MAG TPA: glycosyltransferase, partial [bacterium]|nr:glycosyltransferase [bacterium]
MLSIITVTYNAEACLEKTIQSVINQTYKNIEYIIIDGGSSDKTLSIIKKYKKYIKYCISEPDKGIYDAMNKGIKIAKGDYINFLNAGDFYYENNVLSYLFDNLDKSVDLLYGDSYLIDQNGVNV